MSRSISTRVAVGSAVLISMTAITACGSSDEVAAPPSAVTVTAVATETVTSTATTTATTATTPETGGTTTDDTPTSTSRTTTRAPRTTATGDDMSTSQRNAVAKGRDYLSYAAFSRRGLIEQLAYEGFSTSDATFAVDHIAPDWTEQAVRKAAEYMDYDSFSRQSLLDQLLYEGFTQAQATAGADSQF